MEDKKITISIVVPQSVVDEVDQLVKKPRSPFSSRSHALVQIFYAWKEQQQTPQNQLKAA